MHSVLLAVAITLDILLKVLARITPASAGHFSFSTPFGAVGIAPSVNAVLAFSLPVPNRFIWPVGWVAVVVLVRMWCRAAPATRPAIAATLLGACSNLVDRTFLGGVTDYLSFTDFFPAFNIADLLIMGGVTGWMFGRTRLSRVPS